MYRLAALPLLALAACGSAPLRPDRFTPVRVPPPPPAPPPAHDEVIDSGLFALTMNNTAIGHETFSIERHGDGRVLRSTSELAFDGVARVMSGELETDASWRPRAGTFRDVRGGGTVVTLGGDPMTVKVKVGDTPVRETTTGAFDLFIADNTMVHLAPLCALPASSSRTAFPAMAVAIGADAATAIAGLARRTIDLGGAVKATLYCEGDRLIAVEIPIQAFTAVRDGRQDDFARVRLHERTKPELPAGLTELPRTVKVHASKAGDAAELSCSLLLPATHDARLPAVVFVTGSGAQDRDEDTVGPGGLKLSIFKVLAIALGQAGIASLRCDDRGTGASTGDYGDGTLDTFAADAAATVAALRGEPAIDPARIGVIGHSEGGVIAPMLAARDRRLRAIALMGAPGRTLDVILLEQVTRALHRAGTAGAAFDTALEHHRAAFAAIRARQPLPDTDEAKEWKGGEAWLRSHLHHDPAATAARLGKVAVLIAQGGKDQQVAVADAEALAAAFARARNRRVTYRVYPDLNHLFASSSTGDVSEYADPDATVDATFVTDLVAFFAAL